MLVAIALRGRIALLLGLLASTGQPAQSQGLPQSIFSYGSAGRPYHYPGMSPFRLSPYGGAYSPYQSDWGDDDSRQLDRGVTYRTLCVRLCDGFYFPISGAATQSSFARDADACSASCGSEARLFYHPSAGGDVETMVDLTGMAYNSLRNAFKYRKTLVQGCRCRPQPWSEGELERHRAYIEGRPAATAGAGTPQSSSPPVAQDNPGPPRVAGIDAQTPTPADPRLVPRPPPIARQVEPVQAWSHSGSGNSGPPTSRFPWSADERSRDWR